MIGSNRKFELYNDSLMLYNAMLEDIKNARNFIYLETYRLGNDRIGIKFRDALVKKCKEGVVVKILVDAWGTSQSVSFFSELIKNGGYVRYFEKFNYTLDFFTKNHKRDHRKLLIIDDLITYIGSANITEHCLNWRECVLKISGDISLVMKKTFFWYYQHYIKKSFFYKLHNRTLYHEEFEIICDIPSIIKQLVKKRYEELIRNAKKEIIIETPYFLPGFILRRELMKAAQRNVDVKIIVPQYSDVRLVDILRTKYLGLLHKSNINFLFYLPNNLHSKLIIVDGECFSIGSSNFDYRSFRYMHEIVLLGKEPGIIKLIQNHISETLEDCLEFDYEKWKRRPLIQKLFEWILLPFRHLF